MLFRSRCFASVGMARLILCRPSRGPTSLTRMSISVVIGVELRLATFARLTFITWSIQPITHAAGQVTVLTRLPVSVGCRLCAEFPGVPGETRTPGLLFVAGIRASTETFI